MTTAPERPRPPRGTKGLILPLAIIVAGFGLGGVFIDVLGGAVFGLLSALGLLGGLYSAEIRLRPWETAIVAATTIASAMITAGFLAELPEQITPTFALGLGGTWLVAGLGAGAAVARLRRLSAGANVVAVWAGAGVVVLPIISGLGLLEPGTGTPLVFAAISVVIGLIGGAAVLSAATGVRGLALGSTALVITVFAAAEIGFTITGLIENFANIRQIPNFWPPDFEWAIGEADWWWLPDWDFGAPTRPSPLVETFRIAVIASLIGLATALPLAFMASKVTAPGRLSYLLSKGFMNVIRTVPDLFWALIFVAAVSVGPLAGVLALIFFSLAIMSKLLSETIDAVDVGPLEAARATGGSHFPAVRVSVLPQVLPNYVAYALYIFEINVRASVVLGLVGAGGIGRVLEAQRSFFQFDRMLAVVIVIFVIVFVIEQISVALRRRLV